MAVTHSSDARNGLADYVVDQLDSGFLVFLSSAGSTVARLTFGNPAFTAAATGIATANTITSDTAAVGGNIANAEFRTSASAAVVYCAVSATAGSGDLKLNTTIVNAGQTVAITSLTYEAAS